MRIDKNKEKNAGCKHKAFTLVELLVSLAVITLLVAILVPTLSRARLQTKITVCQSNLKQLSLFFLMYANENSSALPPMSEKWPDALQVSDKAKSLICCPMAARPLGKGGRHPFAAFPVTAVSGISRFGPDSGTIYCSYGLNGWVCNPPPGTPNPFGFPTANNWRTTNVEHVSNVPLLLDSMWIDSYADTSNIPPAFNGDLHGALPANRQIGVFCIDRHNGFVNSAFLDFSLRQVRLKELWQLKWHRNSIIDAPAPNWPDWMGKP
jgi:prepilin-type N-terminal cleavage/methylation domain-containing protein